MTIDAREWLEADGLGGYAMGAADGIRRRRYHAMLCAATAPPGGRMVLVADVEATVATAGGRFAISSHRYRGGVTWPDGAVRLASFTPAPWPRWEYAIGDGARVSFELCVAHGSSQVALRWRRLAGVGPMSVEVRPLLSGRDHHALHHENGAFRFAAAHDGRRVTWRPYDGVPAISAVASGSYAHAPDWYRAFHYDLEEERGLDCEEDLASPGVFTLDLAAGDGTIVFAADRPAGRAPEPAPETASDSADAIFAREAARRTAFSRPLHRAADAYLVARGAGRTIIAGYPWFTDWGRDTFISLRGLCLATGRTDDARAIIAAWCRALDGGMLPNRFVESGESPEYNSVDAALWFVVAADALAATGACTAAERRAIDDATHAIVSAYAAGTRHRIRADGDGLLACGEPGVQLTWMDAKLGDWVVTPRVGKPVEVQALWMNALAIAGRRDPRWRELLARAEASFAARFWDAAHARLFDVIDCDHVPGAVDASFRPNQIFAIGGLPLVLLDDARARAVVDAVERALWTPAGLRSLAPDDPRYAHRYLGGPRDRDAAYHQGTVWTWLAGPFIEAWLRVRGGTSDARRQARARFVAPLLASLDGASTGHLPELADGDPPHAPRGCPFQAWSLAELLRADQLTGQFTTTEHGV